MLAPETRLKDRYRILHDIGGGGFGYVYKAIDEVFGCSVAIKETKEKVATDKQLQKAFEREAMLLRSLKHDCLPRVTDYFAQDDAQFLVMDFIEGEDLATRLQKRLHTQGPFTVVEVLPWADKILRAIEYLHTRPKPIIHRDIKPSNLKLTEVGEIYLLDFGLAKGTAGQMSTSKDGESSFSLHAHTPGYASLEQLQNSGTRTQSDIYSLGATLYHLLTGKIPVSAGDRDEIIQRGGEDPLVPAHSENETIPVAISEIISRATAIRWWERYESANDMREAMWRAWDEHVTTRPSDSQRFPEQPPILPKELGSVREQPDRKASSFNWRVLLFGLLLLAGIIVVPTIRNWPAPITADTNGPTTSKSLTVKEPAQLQVKESRSGHKGIVWSIAYSRDGSRAASSCENGNILLWHTESWTSQPLAGHTGPVYSLAFSPNGELLASASKDRTIKLWDVKTAEFKVNLHEGNVPVFGVAFSPAGDLIAAIRGEPEMGGEELRVWDLRSDWQSKTLSFNRDNRVFAIAFSPDGSTLVAAGYGETIRLCDIKLGLRCQDLHVNHTANEYFGRLAFSRDGSYLAAGNNNGRIMVWETKKWSVIKDLKEQHGRAITALAFSPDGAALISASFENPLTLWHLATGTSKVMGDPAKTRATQRSLTFAPDAQTMLSGGDDQLVNIWQ